MGDVVSLHTKQQLGKQDTVANDKLAEKGTYIGCLPKLEAEMIRSTQGTLGTKKALIDELIDEFDKGYTDYLINVCKILSFLGQSIASFNSATDDLMVGEDGHVWITKRTEDII
jgi:hypothetical protein